MSRLQTQKTALETRRAQQRANVAATPNDRAAADALRQTESELATVNAQLIYGPGAKAVVGAAIGRAAVVSQRNPQRAAALSTPVPMPTATKPTPPRRAFVAESDVPYPVQPRSAAAQNIRDVAGRAVAQPQAAASRPTATPTVQPPANVSSAPPADAPTVAPAAPRYSWQDGNEVAYPPQPQTNASQIFRDNGRR